MANPLKTVAIADDESIVVRLLTRFVTEFGYECVGTAANGAAAVDLVRQVKPQLMLLDFHMPIMDGLEATRQIVALQTTGIVLLTGDMDPKLAIEAMDAGASGYMMKPFESAQLPAVMESA